MSKSKLALTICLSLLVVSCTRFQQRENSEASCTNPRQVDVVADGDDGLTQHVQQSIRNEIERSCDFVLATSSESPIDIVRITGNVEWRPRRGTRLLGFPVRYVISTLGEMERREMQFSCLESDLDSCGRAVVEGLRAVLNRPSTKPSNSH